MPLWFRAWHGKTGLRLVEKIKPPILSLRKTEVLPTAEDLRVLQEAVLPYGQKIDLKNACKAIK